MIKWLIDEKGWMYIVALILFWIFIAKPMKESCDNNPYQSICEDPADHANF